MRFPALILLLCATSLGLAKEPAISWKKTVIDPKFRSEGVAIADVNKDGKMDILVGEFWYEAPDWKAHEMQKPGNYGDGLGGYSKIFACWAEDLNGDMFPDLIVVDFPGAPMYWLENPQGKTGHWKKHIIWHSACNETPLYVDLLGNGQKGLLMGTQPKPETLPKELKNNDNIGQMGYFTPDKKDPTALWVMTPISEPSTYPEVKDGKVVPNTGKVIPGTFKYSHGLGIGDWNGDKKLDVMTVGGWWEQPAKVDSKTPWKFHPNGIGDASADMFAFDVDNDGKMDILHTSAHRFGIWWQKNRGPDKDGNTTFQKQELFKDLVSETHAAHFKDIDGDGQPDLITGKRWWSHGKSEPGSDKPSMIYWLQVKRDSDGMAKFTPMVIDDNSGIGTQFVVDDINGDGKLDVIVSNKKGVHLFLQERENIAPIPPASDTLSQTFVTQVPVAQQVEFVNPGHRPGILHGGIRWFFSSRFSYSAVPSPTNPNLQMPLCHQQASRSSRFRR